MNTIYGGGAQNEYAIMLGRVCGGGFEPSVYADDHRQTMYEYIFARGKMRWLDAYNRR